MFLLTFLNFLFPEELNDGVKVLVHVLVLLHLFAFSIYGVLLLRDLTKSPQKLAQEKIEQFQKKTQ
jgi:uncharacterized protein YhhL (DUF1145 family)